MPMINPSQRERERVPSFSSLPPYDDVAFLRTLEQRAKTLGDGQLDAWSVLMMFSGLRHSRRRSLVVSYPETTSDEEKGEFLGLCRDLISDTLGSDDSLHLVKSVTLTIAAVERTTRVLVVEIGRQLDRADRKCIADKLDLSKNALKAAVINARDGWNPALELGIRPGIIGPFVPDTVRAALGGVFYLQDDLPATTPVGVALSFSDTLIISKGVFEEMLVGTGCVPPENFIHAGHDQ